MLQLFWQQLYRHSTKRCHYTCLPTPIPSIYTRLPYVVELANEICLRAWFCRKDWTWTHLSLRTIEPMLLIQKKKKKHKTRKEKNNEVKCHVALESKRVIIPFSDSIYRCIIYKSFSFRHCAFLRNLSNKGKNKLL